MRSYDTIVEHHEKMMTFHILDLEDENLAGKSTEGLTEGWHERGRRRYSTSRRVGWREGIDEMFPNEIDW